MALVDSSGAAQKGYTYDVYGKPTSTGTLADEFNFAGEQTDPTGLQYLRARYMHPETGTFLSRDPLTAGSGWLGQPFGYASASPATLVDPLGLDQCSWRDPWECTKDAGEAIIGGVRMVAGAADALTGRVAGCLTSVSCSTALATAIDKLVATIDTVAAVAVDAVTIAACFAGPVGCPIGYGLATLAIQTVLQPSNWISLASVVIGCTGLFLGREKEGGGLTPDNAVSCAASGAIVAAGFSIPDANLNAALSYYQVCRDERKCRP